jgi:hypothetical protein
MNGRELRMFLWKFVGNFLGRDEVKKLREKGKETLERGELF